MRFIINSNKREKYSMSILKKTLIASAALALPGLVSANAKLEKMMKDPSQWVQQSGDYAGHRYSELDQINKSNVVKKGIDLNRLIDFIY